MSKKTNAALLGGKEVPRKHHCPIHREECKPVKTFPKGRMVFSCPQGHDLERGGTVLR